MYKYSPSRNSFYPDELLCAYELSGNLPDDLISVSDEVFREFTATPVNGKVRSAGDHGMPTWEDIPPPSHEEHVALAELQKQTRLENAMQSISIIHLKLQAGRKLNELEKMRLNAVLDYINEIEEIDIETSPGINWPTKP